MKRRAFWVAAVVLTIAFAALLGRLQRPALAASPAKLVVDAVHGATMTTKHTLEVVLPSYDGGLATEIPTLENRAGIEIYNRGDAGIECCMGDRGQCVWGRARPVAAFGGSWAVDAPPWLTVWCFSTGAVQTPDGGATIVNQVPRP